MKRRLFLNGGTAAIAVILTGCGRPGPASASEPAPAPGNLPVTVGAMTFQMEFNDPAQPLLQYKNGPFNPYFIYFGGDAQPEGEGGYRWWNDETAVYTTDRYTPAPYNPTSVAAGVLS